MRSYSSVRCSCVGIIPAPDRNNLGTQTHVHTQRPAGTSLDRWHSYKLQWCEVCERGEKKGRAGLTCGEVDVGEQDDVGGDERDELRDADLLFEVDVDHVVVSQAAVG